MCLTAFLAPPVAGTPALTTKETPKFLASQTVHRLINKVTGNTLLAFIKYGFSVVILSKEKSQNLS